MRCHKKKIFGAGRDSEYRLSGLSFVHGRYYIPAALGTGSAWQIVPAPSHGRRPLRVSVLQKKTYRKGCAERRGDYCSRCAKQSLQKRAES